VETCITCGAPIKPATTTTRTVRNGVKVSVTIHPGEGRTVEADCQCFGYEGRCHTSQECPLFKKQQRARR